MMVRVSIVYLGDGVADGELYLTTRERYVNHWPREKVKGQNSERLLLNVYHFHTIVKSKNYKQNHCKLGTIRT